MDKHDQLKELRKAEQEILDVIDQICTENHLRYSLCYGTLLGAVRHKGFIPWDDDVDIMMPAEDYEKLIFLWSEVAPEGYILQTPEMFSDYVCTFAKIRKDHTTFLQFEDERDRSYQKGIFVDIFPFYRRANSSFMQKLQLGAFAVGLLFNRGYTSGSGGVLERGEKVLLHLVPRRFYRAVSKWMGKIGCNLSGKESMEWISPCTIRDCKRYYPAEMFDELVRLEFNGGKYSAIKKYDSFLNIRYGDYMVLPPEEERVWKHHPIVLDFERNYEELVKNE